MIKSVMVMKDDRSVFVRLSQKRHNLCTTVHAHWSVDGVILRLMLMWVVELVLLLVLMTVMVMAMVTAIMMTVKLAMTLTMIVVVE